MYFDTSYKELLELYNELELINSIRSVLYWDMNTSIPAKGVSFRAEQFGYLSRKHHELLTSQRFGSLLECCLKIQELNAEQHRNVQLLKRQYDAATALPVDLVKNLSKQSNKTLEIWKVAKKRGEFTIVVPEMEKLFTLNLEQAQLLAKKKEMNDPFSALIEQRDEGFSAKLIEKLFSEVKAYLIPLVKKLSMAYQEIDKSFLQQTIPRNKLEIVVKSLLNFFEYSMSGENAVGRVDEVEHPLTIGCGPDDVRVTVKYHLSRPMSTFFAASHECGHALHSLQGNKNWLHQPIYHYRSPSLGESQSRFLENIITKSLSFWQYYFPHLKEQANVFNDISLEEFYMAINAVEPGMIRIEADEVTYTLHIIIRFEIEHELFNDKISIKELPEVWNQRYEDYLGVNVPNNTVGVMQDLHWYSQYYGYFFGYGVGDLIAAQIKDKMSKELINWEDKLTQGIFTPIRLWLQKNVHNWGSYYPTLDLVEKITGAPLSSNYHKNYLKAKYSAIL
ncbi:MAG: carboxypeptidase M32 [Candidatus Heimdallarchaeaceae archaeon]